MTTKRDDKTLLPIGPSLWPTTNQPRRIRVLRWQWQVTDENTGQVLAEGHAPTRRWAWTLQDRAASLIHAQRLAAVLQGRAVVRELTGARAAAICAQLANERIPIPITTAMDAAHILHVWPGRKVTTVEEVTALRAFIGATDGRIAWHKDSV